MTDTSDRRAKRSGTEQVVDVTCDDGNHVPVQAARRRRLNNGNVAFVNGVQRSGARSSAADPTSNRARNLAINISSDDDDDTPAQCASTRRAHTSGAAGTTAVEGPAIEIESDCDGADDDDTPAHCASTRPAHDGGAAGATATAGSCAATNQRGVRRRRNRTGSDRCGGTCHNCQHPGWKRPCLGRGTGQQAPSPTTVPKRPHQAVTAGQRLEHIEKTLNRILQNQQQQQQQQPGVPSQPVQHQPVPHPRARTQQQQQQPLPGAGVQGQQARQYTETVAHLVHRGNILNPVQRNVWIVLDRVYNEQVPVGTW